MAILSPQRIGVGTWPGMEPRVKSLELIHWTLGDTGRRLGPTKSPCAESHWRVLSHCHGSFASHPTLLHLHKTHYPCQRSLYPHWWLLLSVLIPIYGWNSLVMRDGEFYSILFSRAYFFFLVFFFFPRQVRFSATGPWSVLIQFICCVIVQD